MDCCNLKIKIQTIHETETGYGTLPLSSQLLNQEHLKMVLRWKSDEGLHAIYAKSYTGGEYSCLNSWGGAPGTITKVHMGEVYAVDYISIVRVE